MENEKYRDYFEIGKNKDLIERHTLTEEDLTMFEDVKKHIVEGLKVFSSAMTIFFLILVLMAFYNDIVSGIVLFIFFGTIDFFIIKSYIKSKRLTPEYCDYGFLIDKFIKKEKGDDDHYIIISVNNNLVKFKVSFSEYESLNLDDEVILFACKDTNDLFYHSK